MPKKSQYKDVPLEFVQRCIPDYKQTLWPIDLFSELVELGPDVTEVLVCIRDYTAEWQKGRRYIEPESVRIFKEKGPMARFLWRRLETILEHGLESYIQTCWANHLRTKKASEERWKTSTEPSSDPQDGKNDERRTGYHEEPENAFEGLTEPLKENDTLTAAEMGCDEDGVILDADDNNDQEDAEWPRDMDYMEAPLRTYPSEEAEVIPHPASLRPVNFPDDVEDCALPFN